MASDSIFKSGMGYTPLFISLLLCAIGSGLHKGILDNYVAEMARMSEMDRGIMEFFRELPGLLLVLILAVLYCSSAERMFKISMIFMAAGMVMQSLITPSKLLVIIAIFIYSTGEHIQIGMRNTLTLEYSRAGHGGSGTRLSEFHHVDRQSAGRLDMEYPWHRDSVHSVSCAGALQQCLRRHYTQIGFLFF